MRFAVLGAALATFASVTLSSRAVAVSGAAVRMAPSRCAPAGVDAIVTSPRVEVYATQGSVFGCVRHGTHRYRLGSSGVDCMGSSGRVEDVTVSGDLAGYALGRCGVDTIGASVVVSDLRTGRRIVNRPAATILVVEGAVTVGEIVLRENGAVAWTVQASSIVAHRSTRQVIEADAHRETVLDTHGAIGLRSLRLAGSTVSWRDGGRTLSARLS